MAWIFDPKPDSSMRNGGASFQGLNFRTGDSSVPTYTTPSCDTCVWRLNARCFLGWPRHAQQGILQPVRCTDLTMRAFESRPTAALIARRNIPLALSGRRPFLAEGSGRRPFDIRPTNSELRILDDPERIRTSSFSAASRTCRHRLPPTW